MEARVTRTGAALGAIVSGIDCRQLDSAAVALLHGALVDHLVICIRGQILESAQYRAAMSRLGTPRLQRAGMRLEDMQEIGIVSTDEKDVLGDGKRVVQGESWHTDESFKAQPPNYTTLYAIVLPSSGGDTQFASMFAAYDDLPDETKRQIEPLQVIHRYDSSRKRGRVVTLSGAEAATMPEVIHPLVRVHPDSQRRALYLNPNRMETIVDMDEDESDRLLNALFEHATQPKYQYRHRWLAGDIVIWDDRCTMHKANPDIPRGERRLMHRMVLADAA
jgi:taurine dioxygenase